MNNFLHGSVLFGKYQIIETLGKGGFSTVYLATNLKLGNKVAIKVVDKSLYQKQLIAEKNILIKLRHSSIVLIFDIEEDDEYFYLVEEYIEGETLENLKERLSEDEAKKILLDLLDVLNFLHTNFDSPIIYRDLKPSNIMIMKNKAIKLIDFGVASDSENKLDASDDNYGTRSYCSPEQISYGTSDERSDIYSLGVTIYYLLTGKNLCQPPYKILRVRDFRKDVSKEFSDIIYKMTQILPSKRYASAKAITNDIQALDDKNKIISDCEFFESKAKRVVYLAGLKRGIGLTHACQMLAHHYSKTGKKVALIEWSNNSDFTKISGEHEEILENKYYYEHRDVHAYFYSYSSYANIIQENYDIIIVDAGSYEDFILRTKNKVNLEVFILASASDWDINSLEDMLYENRENYSYIVNLQNEDFVEKLRKIFSKNPIFALPYNNNPYEIAEENISYLEKICGVKTKNKKGGLLDGFIEKSKDAYKKLNKK